MKNKRNYNAFLLIIGLAMNNFAYAQFGKPNYEKTAMDRAAIEFNCSKDKVKLLREAKYTGGGLIVLNVCDTIVYYECMGTVCQLRCKYTSKPSDYKGDGEADGKFHKQVVERASVEFDCAKEGIKQIKHFDGSGQGVYYLFVKGQEVVYECMGTVCNLKCQ